MSDITVPLDEITIDDLDIDRVYGIAKKELSDTADEKWNPFDNSRVTSMLADWYLDMYFNEAGTFVDGILDGISLSCTRTTTSSASSASPSPTPSVRTQSRTSTS